MTLLGRPAATDTCAAADSPTGGVSRSASLGTYIRAYLALSKPRVIETQLIHTIPVMVVAAQRVARRGIAVATLVIGTMTAASAHAIKCDIARVIVRAMRRTRRRPTAMEQVTPRGTMIYGITLAVLSTVGFVVFVNWLAAALAVFAIAFYIFVYTLLLKRRTAQNVVWGGIAGCMPEIGRAHV